GQAAAINQPHWADSLETAVKGLRSEPENWEKNQKVLRLCADHAVKPVWSAQRLRTFRHAYNVCRKTDGYKSKLRSDVRCAPNKSTEHKRGKVLSLTADPTEVGSRALLS